MIKILDVCSGIGGFSLGLEATGGFDTVAFCEFDEFCGKVLKKHWPDVPIYKDLKEIGNEPTRLIQEFDLICGGIPCQPFSLAGKQKGKEDDRHLWPYMYEIIKHKKPTWVIVENVGGFVNVALDDVCLDLETEGYATQSFIIPACGVEAPHRRERVWILGKNVGNATGNGRTEGKPGEEEGRSDGQSEEGGMLESKGTSDRATGDVVNSKRNEHSEEIGRGDGEAREDEKRQGEEDSTSRISSGASGLRVSDQGHEGKGHVVNTDNLGSLLSSHETERGGSASRHSEGKLERGSSDVADSKSNGEDGVSRKPKSEHGQGDTRLESSSSDNGRSERESSQDVADTNGDREKRNQSEYRQGSGLKQNSSNARETEDVADPSSKRSQGHRGEHGLRETSEEEQTLRGSEERDVSNTESVRGSSDNNNGRSTQSNRESRVQSESGGERSSKGTGEDVPHSGGERGRSGQTDRQDAEDVGELTGDTQHREGNTQPGLGGMDDGVSSRLDGHQGFITEPDIPRVAEKIPDRVNRLKALGNSIVPQIIYHIGMAILEEEEKSK